MLDRGEIRRYIGDHITMDKVGNEIALKYLVDQGVDYRSFYEAVAIIGGVNYKSFENALGIIGVEDLLKMYQELLYQKHADGTHPHRTNVIGEGVIVKSAQGIYAITDKDKLEDYKRKLGIKIKNDGHGDNKDIYVEEKPIELTVPIYGKKEDLEKGKVYFFNILSPYFFSLSKNTEYVPAIYTSREEAEEDCKIISNAIIHGLGYSEHSNQNFIKIYETDLREIDSVLSMSFQEKSGIKRGLYSSMSPKEKEELLKSIYQYDYIFHKEGNEDGLHYDRGFVFATALSQLFGYQIEALMSDDYVAYVYCTFDLNGKRHYVDINGITDDFQEMMEKRDEFLSNFTVKTKDFEKEIEMPANFDYLLSLVNEFIEKNVEYYTPSEQRNKLPEQEEPSIESSSFDFDTDIEEMKNRDLCRGYCSRKITKCDFLDKYRVMFAEMLSQKFGYRIEATYYEHRLEHVYCVFEHNGKTYYIDIRGITDNWYEFKSGLSCRTYYTIGGLKNVRKPEYDELATLIARRYIDVNASKFVVPQEVLTGDEVLNPRTGQKV
ncbi:MAG: hypothetical protein GX951_03315 [Mollicutes bacterium]|nr:hypothetical protein [Mollicutes bacterium]